MAIHDLGHHINNSSFVVTFRRLRLAARHFGKIHLGQYFVFLNAGLPESIGPVTCDATTADPKQQRVFPLPEGELDLGALYVKALPRRSKPLSCLFSDRNLVGAGGDMIHFGAVLFGETEGVTLLISLAGRLYDQQDLDFQDGLATAAIGDLVPGSYEATLVRDGVSIGSTLAFEAAEYQLAPLSVSLKEHSFDAATGELLFDLEVTSFNVPCVEPIQLLVKRGDDVLDEGVFTSLWPGLYFGSLVASDQGIDPIVLNVHLQDDPGCIAQVPIPGSGARSAQSTLVNPLGRQRFFSTLDSLYAQPLRGGYLEEGAFVDQPLIVNQTVTDCPQLHINRPVRQLSLVSLNVEDGTYETELLGDFPAGSVVHPKTRGAVCVVVAGCFVDRQPFEAFTTFFRKTRFTLGLTVPSYADPDETMTVRLTCNHPEPVPVLVWMRDRRLTAAKLPDIGLAENTKQSVADATLFLEEGVRTLSKWMDVGRASLKRMKVWYRRRSLPRLDFIEMGEKSDHPLSLTMDYMELEKENDYEEESGHQADPSENDKDGDLIPETLFFETIWVDQEASLRIPVGPVSTTYRVEAFSLNQGDWQRRSCDITVEKATRVHLELPRFALAEDGVVGRLRCVTDSQRADVVLKCDGKMVPMFMDGQPYPLTVVCPAVLTFTVKPGRYRAYVEDTASGEREVVEQVVMPSGSFTTEVKYVQLLRQGSRCDRDAADVERIELIAGFQKPKRRLFHATASYEHQCCEQNAAKILAAAYAFRVAEKEGHRAHAQNILLTCIEVQRSMFLPGAGFSLYPKRKSAADSYGREATLYLLKAVTLLVSLEVAPVLASALAAMQSMAHAAASAYGLEVVPSEIKTFADALAVARAGDHQRASQWLNQAVIPVKSGAHWREKGQVARRHAMAHAAAAYLVVGEIEKAFPLANEVLGAFNAQGRLYSTRDSVAAIDLLQELDTCSEFGETTLVAVNGVQKTPGEAAAFDGDIQSIEALAGPALIQVTRRVTEDWLSFGNLFPMLVSWCNATGPEVPRFRGGDRVLLKVELPGGYQDGDLALVSLPLGLARICGGGLVRQFSVDFEGECVVTVECMVTTHQSCRQTLVVCVRNMFREERKSCPGPLSVRLNR